MQKEDETIYDNKHYLIEMIVIGNASMRTIYGIIQIKYHEINNSIAKGEPLEIYVNKLSKIYYYRPKDVETAKLYNFTNISFMLEYQKNQKIVKLECERNFYNLFFKGKKNEEKFEIFCREQFEKIPINLNIPKPMLESDGITCEYSLYKFRNISAQNTTYIKNAFEFKILTQNEFKDFIERFQKVKFLGAKFKAPSEFEPNFEKYFSFGKQLMKMPFTIYNNINNPHSRSYFIEDILHSKIGKNIKYYGFPGIGKSVTLIGAIKYNFNQSQLKLYINCKYMHKLNKSFKFLEIKQNLIDEIPFLFFEDYNHYINTANSIINYNSDVKNEDFYWDLIDFLLNSITSSNFFANKKIIIAFDQYNQKVDNKNKYKYLCEKYLYSSNKFSFITLSSLNDSDIRIYKENKLEQKYGNENPAEEIKIDLNIPDLSDKNENNEIKDENKMDIIEDEEDIEDDDAFLTDDESEISNEEEEEEEEITYFEKKIYQKEEEDNDYDYDKALESLGRTIKYYNILEYIKLKGKDENRLSRFLIKTKRHIKKKILKFYKCKNIKDLQLSNQIFSFSLKKKYDKAKLFSFIKIIPFKYFDIKINKKKKKRIFKIKVNFPIIEEVLVEIYEEFISCQDNLSLIYEKILEGEYGPLFEKTIIFLIEYKNSFILKHKGIEIVKKFLPKKNEKAYKKEKAKKKTLNKGTYLFKQKIFGGKAFDFLIIKIKNDSCLIYVFQISIYKDIIYNKNQVLDYMKQMVDYLNRFYYFPEEKHFFFGYIFNYERFADNNNSKYNNMLNKCEHHQMNYCFFSSKEKDFVDKFGKPIKNINNIVSIIGSNEDIKNIEEPQSQIIYYIFQEEYSKQKEAIIQLLSNNGAIGNKIDFIENEYIDIKILSPNKCYIQKTKNNKKELIIIYSQINNDQKILKIKIINSDGNCLDYNFNEKNYEIDLNSQFDLFILKNNTIINE